MAQALSLSLAAAILLCGCSGRLPQSGVSSQEARRFSLTRSRAGEIEWKLDSPKAILNESVSKAKVETPLIALYKDGKPETEARSMEGEIDLRTQDMDLSGSVVVINKTDHITLKTDQLRYVSTEKQFQTDRPVEIDRPDGVMHGRGLTASQDLSTIHVMHQETRAR